MFTFSRFMLAPAVVFALASGCSSNEGAADMMPNTDQGAGGGSVQFTASGEVLALGGYNFPPAGADDPAFVDGWELKFDELLVTFQDITLSENPDKVPTDQSQNDAPVARITGPFAVDLHKGGPLRGKGGADEQAVAIATVMNQNLNGNKPFDATRRYAFGFDVVAASAGATKVNLDAQAQQDYAMMVANGWTVLYVGTATFKGTSCTSTNPAYDFAALPKVVKFKLGFSSPTTYVNCQNPDNDPADPFGNEEHQRGLQIKNNTTTIAQATVHSDHPFWENVEHDSAAHFDQLAAHAKPDGAGNYTVTMNDLKGVNFTAFKDSTGKSLP